MGEGTVEEAGTYDTHGLLNRGSVVKRAIASTDPGSGVSGANGEGAAPARSNAATAQAARAGLSQRPWGKKASSRPMKAPMAAA